MDHRRWNPYLMASRENSIFPDLDNVNLSNNLLEYNMEKNLDINNEIYNTLGDRWYTAQDDPVALLRSESKTKAPWVIQNIKEFFGNKKDLKILDVGCGAGFLSNRLALESYRVTGVDLSEDSLRIAKKYDKTGAVEYQIADANQLPFKNNQFDVVTAMDFLEHVTNPQEIITEISRVLSPGGLFFFHTFNRNLLSHLVIIKMVEWLVKNTPKNMHVPNLFIKPQELMEYCRQNGMSICKMTGIRPKLSTIMLKDKKTLKKNSSEPSVTLTKGF